MNLVATTGWSGTAEAAGTEWEDTTVTTATEWGGATVPGVTYCHPNTWTHSSTANVSCFFPSLQKKIA